LSRAAPISTVRDGKNRKAIRQRERGEWPLSTSSPTAAARITDTSSWPSPDDGDGVMSSMIRVGLLIGLTMGILRRVVDLNPGGSRSG
jgi:hypothetical protein